MGATFSLTEAAAVTGLDIRAVNKAVENDVVRISRGRARAKARGRARAKRRQIRRVSMIELLCLQLEYELAHWLPLQVRRDVIRRIARSPRVSEFSPNETLIIRVGATRNRLAARLKELHLAKRMVEIDPEVMGGEPVLKGTRVPVYLIAGMVEDGVPVEEILEGYPILSAEQVDFAPVFSQAYPRRGRPTKRRWHEKGPVKISRVA